MRFIWTTLEFRMCLCSNEPRMIRKLNHLYDMTIRGQTGEHHTVICQDFSVIIIYFITMSVTLVDMICAI